MPFDPVPREGRRALRQREVLVLENAAGTVISVDSGCLWLTMERDTRDVMLLPGMRFEIDRDGRTVIVAEEHSRLRVTAPDGRARDWVARIRAWAAQRADRLLAAWSLRLPRQRVPYC